MLTLSELKFLPDRRGGIMIGDTLHTLTIDHKHGTDTRVFVSEAGARAALVAWVHQWSEQELGRSLKDLPDDVAISTYFEEVEEFYSIDSPMLEG